MLKIEKIERFSGRVYRHATCDCGKAIILEAFTNECDHCGRLYNWVGQSLAPVSQWGEETGEHWSECW